MDDASRPYGAEGRAPHLARVPLFVNGTLRRGHSHHHLLGAAHPIVEARVRGRLYRLPEGYPVLVPTEDTRSEVHGELCFFADISCLWSVLDPFEDYDPRDRERSLYLRRVVRTTELQGSQRSCHAWSYVIPPARERELLQRGAHRLRAPRWHPAS